MFNDILKGFYGDQALSPHEAEQKTPLNKPLTESNEIQTSQSVNRRNVNSNFQKWMSATGHIGKPNRTIDSKFTELKQQFVVELVTIHKKFEENKEERQQIWEKLQQVKEELQQFKEQDNHLIEPDPMSTVVKGSNLMLAAYDTIRVLLEHLDQVTHQICMKTEDGSNYIGPVSYWKGHHKKRKSGSYSFIWNLATDQSYLQQDQAKVKINIQAVNDLLSAIHEEACIDYDYEDEYGSIISKELALFSARCTEERNTAAHPLSKPQKDVRLQMLDNLQTCQVEGSMPAPYNELGNLLEAGIKFGKARASGK
ncbi:unnamed protein product [Sphagnum balticum]